MVCACACVCTEKFSASVFITVICYLGNDSSWIRLVVYATHVQSPSLRAPLSVDYIYWFALASVYTPCYHTCNGRIFREASISIANRCLLCSHVSIVSHINIIFFLSYLCLLELFLFCRFCLLVASVVFPHSQPFPSVFICWRCDARPLFVAVSDIWSPIFSTCPCFGHFQHFFWFLGNFSQFRRANAATAD